MRTRTIPKENTTLGCHESFLLENCTMIEKENHPRLEMLMNQLLVDRLYLLTTIMVDLLEEVVMGLKEIAIVDTRETKI